MLRKHDHPLAKPNWNKPYMNVKMYNSFCIKSLLIWKSSPIKLNIYRSLHIVFWADESNKTCYGFTLPRISRGGLWGNIWVAWEVTFENVVFTHAMDWIIHILMRGHTWLYLSFYTHVCYGRQQPWLSELYTAFPPKTDSCHDANL